MLTETIFRLAGSSAAYHLAAFAAKDLFDVNITILERNPYVGGRSTTVDVYDDPSQPVELGASIFVAVNHILVSATRDLNLSVSAGNLRRIPTAGEKEARQELGIWNGYDFVWRQAVSGRSKSEVLWDYARLFWRYGVAPKRAVDLVGSVIGRFLMMYDEPYFPFRDLSEIAFALNLTDATASTGRQYFYAGGVSSLFVDELVQSATRVNYAQNIDEIHGLEALVSMAADGAMSVSGGNWRIFQEMIRHSKATTLLKAPVTSVSHRNDGQYEVQWHGSGAEVSAARYDEVILAAPFHQSKITFEPPLERTPDDIPYIQLHVTLFTSKTRISGAFFGVSSPPEIILTTLPPTHLDGGDDIPFKSISLLRTLRNPRTGTQEYLYKIFSTTQYPSEHDILRLLQSSAEDNAITWIRRKTWLSYPVESPRVTFEELRLDNGIWFTAGMESFISTMETNSLMGKNIARLMVDSWKQAS